MSSALQRQMAERYTRGDRDGVDRTIACGMNFYAAMALVQIAALLAIAYVALPYYAVPGRVVPPDRQAALGPGADGAVLRALDGRRQRAPGGPAVRLHPPARDGDDRPPVRAPLGGLHAGVDFFAIVVAQTAVQIGLSLGPALWVMVRELGYVPHFPGRARSDYAALLHISFYMSLIQFSVVLADKIDTTVLGFALRPTRAPAITVYQNVSKPFLQIRQTGWTLAYLVMPAVASLAAARDERGSSGSSTTARGSSSACSCRWRSWPGSTPAPFLTLWVGAAGSTPRGTPRCSGSSWWRRCRWCSRCRCRWPSG